jgi:predicted ATPase with chaperone activity
VIASLSSATILGARGFSVQFEVHAGRGLPGFSMLGLPDEACREARDRVRAAVPSSGLNWPDQKITVNLAPPHDRKMGSGLDLPIALGVLLATQQLPAEALATTCALGELGLDGSIRPTARLHENSIEIVHLLKNEALTLGQIIDRLSLPIGETVIVMSELVQRKIIIETNGWFELAGSILVSGGEP